MDNLSILVGLILVGFYHLSDGKIVTNVIQIINKTNLNDTNATAHHSETFKVVAWKLEELKTYLIFGFFIVMVVLMKIAYSHMRKVSKFLPESCLLLMIGILFGVLIKFVLKRENIIYFKLTPHLFFNVLLPPIILESSYALYHRNFLDNLLAILVFAVFGTLFNFLIIGFALWGFSQIGLMKKLQLSLLHCLLFSSLIVAVDPVAVLAIFNEVGVNEDLYYLVFGESLLNDAVTVVLYEMMQEFAMMKEIGSKNMVLGFVSFFTVSFGGMIIGIIIGMLSCVIIRGMEKKNTVFLEPILLISMGYMAYLCADVFAWSGIISIISCGLIQAAYALPGLSDKTKLVLRRFVKILASICEPLIFLFLGVEVVIGNHSWEVSFIMCSLILCLVTRFLVTFVLSGFINYIHMSLRSIPLQEKFIISYGGLRGAVAFSLAVLIKPEIFLNSSISNETIITTTLVIILFTIIVQGMTVKPLVRCLQIAKLNKSNKISLFTELNDSIMDASMKALEAVVGKCGRNYVLRVLEEFSEKHLRPLLTGKVDLTHAKLMETNDKINAIILHNLAHNPAHSQLQRLPNSYQNLLTAMTAPKPKPVEEIPMIKVRPKLMHSVSDATEIKPIKHITKYLPRMSQYQGDDLSLEIKPRTAQSFVQNSATVVKAKGKFLDKLHRQNEPIIEEAIPLEDLRRKSRNKSDFQDVSRDKKERKGFY